MIDRRRFVGLTVAAGAGLGASSLHVLRATGTTGDSRLYKISLAQWSLHRMLREGKLDALAFPMFARRQFGIEAVEYVNVFFMDRAADRDYLGEMRTRAEDADVRSLLIMVDGEGRLGDPDAAARTESVERHLRWVEAAGFLGCHSIRVNAASAGSRETQRDLAADGLRRLTELAAERSLNVIVENHGGLSSDGAWLAEVMRLVDHPRCGTLPDFGNFSLGNGQTYDRYLGVRELMPFAKALSAKSFAFDEEGEETTIDFRRMMRIVVEAGYRDFVGIEFEGDGMSEVDGVQATKSLLERVRAELEADPAY